MWLLDQTKSAIPHVGRQRIPRSLFLVVVFGRKEPEECTAIA